MVNRNGQISVALLINGDFINKWAHISVNKMLTVDGVKISHIISKSSVDAESSFQVFKQFYKKAVEYRTWGIQQLVHSNLRSASHYQDVRISRDYWGEDVCWIDCKPIPANDVGNEIPAKVIDQISNKVDVIIRFGFGILKGQILNAANYGVLSYHHGDIRRYRGRPPGVWEFLNDEDVAHITLQRLNSGLDSGEIVVFKQVKISDKNTWQEVQSELFKKSTDMLKTGIQRIRDPHFKPKQPEVLGDVYTFPGFKDNIRLVLKNLHNEYFN